MACSGSLQKFPCSGHRHIPWVALTLVAACWGELDASRIFMDRCASESVPLAVCDADVGSTGAAAPKLRVQEERPSLEALAEQLIGKTVEELRDSYPAARDSFYADDSSHFLAIMIPVEGSLVAAVPCVTVEVGPGWMEPLTTPSGTVATIRTADPALRTGSGLRPGSTLGEIRAAFGRVVIGFQEAHGYFAVIVGTPLVRFLLDRFDATPLRGWEKWRDGVSLCPELAPDSARVAEVWLSDYGVCERSGT